MCAYFIIFSTSHYSLKSFKTHLKLNNFQNATLAKQKCFGGVWSKLTRETKSRGLRINQGIQKWSITKLQLTMNITVSVPYTVIQVAIKTIILAEFNPRLVKVNKLTLAWVPGRWGRPWGQQGNQKADEDSPRRLK